MGHYHEELPSEVKRICSRASQNQAKARLERRLLERDVTMGGKRVMPTSFLPRVLPKSYEPVVEKASRLLTEAMLETVYNNPGSLNIPGFNRLLIRDIGIIEKMPVKTTATCRYDFAVSGEPAPQNPPKLLEVNCVDYGGTGWVPNTMRALIETIPELSDIVKYNDLIAGMAQNFKRMGQSALFVTAGEPSFPDYALFENGMKEQGIAIGSISDEDFKEAHRKGKLRLSKHGIKINAGAVDGEYDFLYLRCFSTSAEVRDGRNAVMEILEKEVPVYDNLFGLLLENKSAHSLFKAQAKALFSDEDCRFLEKVFLDSFALDKEAKEELLSNPRGKVLKFCDGHMGQRVFANETMIQKLKAIKHMRGWVVQDFVPINTAYIEPLHSERFRGIVDLSVYASYVFNSAKPKGRRMEEFSVSSYLCRSSADTYKVNVSSGGCFVPVFFLK